MDDLLVPNYNGFKYLQPLVYYLKLPIDQLNFVVTQMLCLFLAYIFRSKLCYTKTSRDIRLIYCLFLGVSILYYCFGKWLSTFLFSYLSCIHLSRMTNKYQTYTLDITGPLMVMTQKLTNLAFGLHDGLVKKNEQLTPLLEKHSIKCIPNLLEYFSYCLHFQTLMAGPFCFYKDYIDFIEGNNFKQSRQSLAYQNYALFNNEIKSNNCEKRENENLNIDEDLSTKISIMQPFIRKTLTCIILGYFLIYIRPIFPVQLNYNLAFIQNYSLLERSVYLYISNAMQRIKYYFAWTCADLVSNVSGLGFNGFDKLPSGALREKWDLITNINIVKFETSISLHEALSNWNISTMAWLRHLVYERVKIQRTLSVYIVSAFWHGFFPGYYLTFISGALFTEAAKLNRRKYRKFFMKNRYVKFIYDIFTCLLTRIVIAYLSMPFVILNLASSLIIYDSMYYWPHFGGFFSILTYYLFQPRLKKTPTTLNIS